MLQKINNCRDLGAQLAQRLGLKLPNKEGHDLAGPCVACQSSDAFRLHQVEGVAQCYSCNEKWSPFQLAEHVLVDHEAAIDLMIELGVFEPRRNLSLPKPSGNALEIVAKQKGVSAHSLQVYGGKSKSSATVSFPCYGPDGAGCSNYSLKTDGGKGKFQRGKPAGLFFPHESDDVRLPQPGETWLIVEGVKDAAALHSLGFNACGLNTCRLAAKFAALFQGVDVILIPDRDAAGEKGAIFSGAALRGVTASTRVVTLPVEFRESKGQDVRDVLRIEGGRELLLQAIENAQPWTLPAEGLDDRPEILVTPDEHVVNDLAVQALARDESIFQRSGCLANIRWDTSKQDHQEILRPANSPQITPIREATLRERLSGVARFVKEKKGDDGEESYHVHPPGFCVSALSARGHWPGVRHLEGIINSPILRADGSILSEAGYDAETGLYYEPNGLIVDVPESPTEADAKRARDVLLEVVVDFPFDSDVHRACWLAFLLTPLARQAFCGPSPLFLIDANTAGTGKTMLADLVALTVSGRGMPRMAAPDSDTEMRKQITSLALAGDQMVLIDNVEGGLGSPSLDAALTANIWKDRLLGKSEMIEMPLQVTWSATGKNMMLRADTARRSCHIRLKTSLENPEERTEFLHSNLLQWTLDNRAHLLGAALTLLSAYCRAGKPDQQLPAWGSFEGWSDLVRQAIVWVGLPDPAATRQSLRSSSDREAAALRVLLTNWEQIDPNQTGLKASELIQKVQHNPDFFAEIRNAIWELCGVPEDQTPNSNQLGNKLRYLRERVVSGKALDGRDSHGTTLWRVTDVEPISAADDSQSGWV